MNIKKDIRFRVYIAFTCIALLGLLIIIKAARIQTTEGAALRQKSISTFLKNDTLRAERGNIYTEDGHLLCSSIPQFDIHLDLSVIKKDTFNKYLPVIANGISSILRDESADYYRKELAQAYNDTDRYYELARNVAYDKYLALRSLPVFKLGPRAGGFMADAETRRINPYGFLAFRTIGLYRKNAQKVGLEGTYDSLLSGEDGSRIRQKMTGGVMVPVPGSEIDAVDGSDLVTTLDLGIQNVAEHALLSVLQQYKCLNGTAIVMEVATGKVRAMVNLGRDEKTGNYYEDQNYALTPAEPGSTFKLTTLLSLLNDGYIKITDNVNCQNGSIQFGPRVMRDSHSGLGNISIKDAYAHSSNCGMAWLAYQHYYKEPEKYIAHLREFGVNQRTGIDIGGEPRPFMATPENAKIWNSTTLPWMATGYGILITPMRTCMLYNGIANGGKMMKPYLVSSVREYGKEVKRIEPTVVIEKMGDTSTIRQLQDCMREVVLTGTATHIRSPHYMIAGKTGTAQVADKIGGKWYPYSAGVYQGSFVGFFPADPQVKPKYTICVVVRTAPHSGAYYGGTIAAPVFRMISDKIFATGMGAWKGPLDSLSKISGAGAIGGLATTASAFGTLLQGIGMKAVQAQVANNRLAMLSTDSSKNIQLHEKALTQGTVPDVTGMGLRDAVYIIESAGMQVQIIGKGAVTSQSIAPGTRTVKGQLITLQLS